MGVREVKPLFESSAELVGTRKSNRSVDKFKWYLEHSFVAVYCVGAVCPKSSDPLYIVIYYIEWVTTSWTHSSSDNFG